ncbi:MAG TPA: hypothetical protein VGH57_23590, partial [Amycolatopsis sp.]
MSTTAIHLPGLADIRRADRAELAEWVRLLIQVSNQCDALAGAAITKVESEGVKATYGYSSVAAIPCEDPGATPVTSDRVPQSWWWRDHRQGIN